jgi:hypothetical protein
MTKRTVTVNDKMQKGYSYELSEPAGEHFDPRFKPELSPKEMLQMGVFGGVYMRDCAGLFGQEYAGEFPADWFAGAKFQKLESYKHDPALNFFGVNASQPLSVWRAKGWIREEDPRGWFQWYCRYWLGRRGPDDERQIKRWRAIARHVAQLKKNCRVEDFSCRPVQRQALLHWAYDSRKM